MYLGLSRNKSFQQLQHDIREMIKLQPAELHNDVEKLAKEIYVVNSELSEIIQKFKEKKDLTQVELKLLLMRVNLLYNPSITELREQGMDARRGFAQEYRNFVFEKLPESSILDEIRTKFRGLDNVFLLVFRAGIKVTKLQRGDEIKEGDFKIFQNLLISFLDDVISIINDLTHIDSIEDQAKSSLYEVEDHAINEMLIRFKIKAEINNQPIPSEDQTDSLIITEKTGQYTLNLIARNDKSHMVNDKAFDESERVGILYGLFKRIISRSKEIALLKRSLSKFEEIEVERARKISAISSEHISKQQFREILFFNKNTYKIFLRYGDKIEAARENSKKSAEIVFLHKIIPFLIFHEYQLDTFHGMFHAVNEDYYLKMSDRHAFLHYDSGRKASREIILRYLERQNEQNDITQEDHTAISAFMEEGFIELEKIQNTIVKQMGNGSKLPPFANFVKRPYVVHNLMLHICKIAVLSEGRARVNMAGRHVYNGRENGFEGGNTVGVHCFNDYIKYTQMLDVVSQNLPLINDERFGNFEHFKTWIWYAFHDAATYDLQNSISWSLQGVYKYDNKQAHQLIGSFLLRENKIIKELFGTKVDTFNPDRVEHKELDEMVKAIQNHDYTQVHFDMLSLSSYCTVAQMREAIMFSLSGLADNSAGIGFIRNGHVEVDTWIEKGTAVFTIPGNAEIYAEMLGHISRDKTHYDNDELFAEVSGRLKRNIEKNAISPLREVLLSQFENEFNVRSVELVSGILNTGYLEAKSYNGETLVLDLVMDKTNTENMIRNYGVKFAFKRIEKWVSEYKHKEFSVKDRTIKIFNTGLDGEIIEGSVGVLIAIRFEENVTQKITNYISSVDIQTHLNNRHKHNRRHAA